MNYLKIEKSSIANGTGIRVVLWVSGCRLYCKGCQNPQSWCFNAGELFDEEAKKELFESLNKPYIQGITFSGGHPLENENVETVYSLCKEIKEKFPTKDIWLYTGYQFEDITSYLINGTDVYSSLGINIVEKSELYTYLSNPEKYDRTYLALFSELAFFGEKSLPLLQEINLCLKEEVREGYLTQDMYEYFINSALEIYLDESQELYDKFLDAIINNKSVDGFKLSLSRYDIA